MDNILFINSCVRPNSRTKILADTVLKELGGKITEVNLEIENIQPLNSQSLKLRDELLAAQNYDHPMLSYARAFKEADTIVVAAPYWDLLFPASVRAYFEHVTVSGVTFYYSPEGIPQSLCKAKKLIYVATAGGPVFGENLGYSYVKAVAKGFFGIEDTRYVDAQGLDIWGADVEAIMEEANKKAQNTVK